VTLVDDYIILHLFCWIKIVMFYHLTRCDCGPWIYRL